MEELCHLHTGDITYRDRLPWWTKSRRARLGYRLQIHQKGRMILPSDRTILWPRQAASFTERTSAKL